MNGSKTGNLKHRTNTLRRNSMALYINYKCPQCFESVTLIQRYILILNVRFGSLSAKSGHQS
jgi:hypothetical protein